MGGKEKFILAINYDVNIFYRSIIDAPLGLRFTLRAKLYIFVSSPLRSNAIVNILVLRFSCGVSGRIGGRLTHLNTRIKIKRIRK